MAKNYNAQTTASKILNAVWNDASTAYQSVVPYVGTNTNINEFAKPLISEANEYEAIQNEFVKTLVNRICFTIIEARTWENRLARLKKGYKAPLGTDVQHVYTNPINPRKYNGKNLSAILSFYDSDTKVAYYRRNREDMFPLTVNREELAGAFVSWETFNSFVSNLVNAIYSGNEIREYNLCKQAIVDATNAGILVKKYVEYPTAENAKDIIAEIKTVSTNMEFATSKYNRYKETAEAAGAQNVKPVVTWTPPERKVILMRTDILEKFSVEVLASAFNMTEAEFRYNLIAIDDFGYDIYNLETGDIDGHVKSNIGFVIADEATFQIYDNLKKSGGSFNDASLLWQFFYHVWQTYGICPFSNCVVYETSNAPVAVGISADKTVVEINAETTTDNVVYSFVPDTYAGEVEMTLIDATKDGAAIASSPAKITINQETKTVTIKAADSLASGSYEAKYSLHVKGHVFPNVVISVGVTVQ